ncbi:MAG: helix-turn-helix domain-containing protein [Clostridia bacterium]|nr:helix-turn-helix domain-containing protein [Clostridia bacterium]
MTLFILEDDPTMLETLKTRIDWAGMGFDRVLSAESVPQGRKLLAENGAQLLLLDVEVIRGTGLELLRWAREHGFDAKCVFLTNYANFDYAKEAMRLGSLEYVLKTEPLSAVEDAVRRAALSLRPEAVYEDGDEPLVATSELRGELRSRVTEWEKLLVAGHRAALLEDMRRYLDERERAGDDNAGVRMAIQHDFTQMVYQLLKRRDLQASAMFENDEDALVYRAAPNSAFDLLRWLNRFCDRAISLLSNAERRETVASRVRNYILSHYMENLTRQTLASMFFVNPDHLSHVFKSEYGVSLVDFISNTRIEQAKLLLLSGVSVSETAALVGFDNFAYFSTVFKKLAGVTPSEFRKGTSD